MWDSASLLTMMLMVSKCTIKIVTFPKTQKNAVTRAVRGSDYNPATALSEEKDKLVTENWKDREKKYQRIIPKPHAHLHSTQKISAKFQSN